MKKIIVILALIVSSLFAAPMVSSSAATAPCVSAAPATIKHVVWYIFENRSQTQVKGHAPYFDSVAAQCGYTTKYNATDHPSLPNYLEMTSGMTAAQAPNNDCPTFCPQSGPSIFGQNASWKIYAESMPSNCLKHDSGQYRTHHTAAPYYTALTNCNTNQVPLTQLNVNALPAFSIITPNVAHDMHENSSSVSAGNLWLSQQLPALLATADYQAGNTIVFVTFDEGGKNCGCSNNVLTIVLSKSVHPGTVSATAFTHYSLLRTSEEILGYPLLGLASSATSMRSAFGL